MELQRQLSNTFSIPASGVQASVVYVSVCLCTWNVCDILVMWEDVFYIDITGTATVSPSAPSNLSLQLETIPAVFQHYQEDYTILGWLLLGEYWNSYQIPDLLLL